MNKLSAFLKHFLKPYSLFPKKAICFSGSIFLSSSLILVLAAVWKDFERVFIIFATTNLAAGVEKLRTMVRLFYEKDIKPFIKYFTELVMTEVHNDVLFITEHNENIWWYDGERVVFRSQEIC